MQGIEKLQQAIYKTIDDIEYWQEVLRLLCEVTGASKGIISLRDSLTAELVIPTDVRQELSSPLLYGFSEMEIGSYVTHYIEQDPWTPFEKLFHPSEPTSLAKFVDLKTLQNSEFWQWLEPQGITDTTVLEIGLSAPNWIAMNLYYPTKTDTIKKKVLQYTTKLQETMQDAWRIGQRLRASEQAPNRLGYFLERQPQAALILSAAGEIILENKKALTLKETATNIYHLDNQRFGFNDPQLQLQLLEAMQTLKISVDARLEEIKFSSQTLDLTLTLIEKAEDQLGADSGARLLSIRPVSAQLLPIWNNVLLTKRERQLVELLANGDKVVDFINHYQMSKSTGHFHWQNVKRKLEIKDRSEIQVMHQLYLQNL